jgi:diaminopropionate ammonia-lyase
MRILDLVVNESRVDDPAPHALLSEFARAYEEIVRWPGYRSTPLRDLPVLARRFGVRRVLYKDEGRRFGGTSFKMLGGSYAVAKSAQRSKAPSTFVAATGGNHGASVAWAARRFSCDCVLYIAEDVSAEREMHLERLGAQVIRVRGDYDAAVATAESNAVANGWILVGDTSARSDDPVVVDVMAGYGVLARELVAQLEDESETATHIFIPCGVGGLAAAVIAYVQNALPGSCPTFVACEPEGAGSVLASIRSGALSRLSRVRSNFSCLACGCPSAAAWEILQKGLDAAVAIPDEEIRAAQNMLRSECRIDAGETAGAGVAAFTRTATEMDARLSLGIDDESIVVILGTEGTVQ